MINLNCRIAVHAQLPALTRSINGWHWISFVFAATHPSGLFTRPAEHQCGTDCSISRQFEKFDSFRIFMIPPPNYSCCASMQILFPSLANDQFSCLILLDTWKFGCKILWLGNCLASDNHYHHHEIMMIFMSDDDNGRVVLVATDWHGPECLFSDVPQRNCNGLVLPSSSSSKM